MKIESLDIWELALIGGIAVFFLAQVYWYIRYLAAPMRQMRRSTKDKGQGTKDEVQGTKEEWPGVSVVLCAHNEAYNISNYLQALLTQDYPEYEVIVVDDGSEDDTRVVLDQYIANDPRLRMTFVPYGARVGSTKKLALTLAAKASKYDYLLLTDADCVPESKFWIREMMRGFWEKQSTKDIVLGFGAYFEEKGHVNRLVRFDTLFNGLHYLGAALCGHPYMGVGRNLAYRKEMFFESGGFTKLMTKMAGDDDLFVNHVATKENTAVVLSCESFTWSPAKKTLGEWLQQKRRHISVSPAYKRSTQFRLTIEPLTRGLFYAGVLGTIIGCGIGCLSPVTLYVVLGLFLVRWMMQALILDISARRMRVKGFGMLSILWFDITLPLVNLWMLAVPKRTKIKW